ncbi:ABC transporter substrate-binding protein [Aeromicrobium sp. A1-2]|uniref:ABC transporter substrate-binding protein n=1 Tax=Aeromicrobium sp. A1-2 TaxID=2107713 RepID=UPI000E4B5AF9|nr:ABC transporter substrate-binding protein [Aeromicrobium sp. A1-2]AXT86285.1 ABC transporter substrate-binding protein [Aeromicrobium sp. A1-2]
MPHKPVLRRLAVPFAVAAVTLAACGTSEPDAPAADSADWSAVLSDAKGQTVNWYMYGGDDALNAFVKDEVAPRLAKRGVTLKQVRITDTADAVNKVLGEKQAGRTSGGAVDAIWVNGENFATGVQADIWSCGWADDLPNAKYVDLTADAVKSDFGVPVDGCEAAWQQASSALVYDSADLDPADVASVDSLLAWAKTNPGKFTYPAPPDFTGSMAVRSLLYDQIGGPSTLAGAFDEQAYTKATAGFYDRLNQIEPSLWRQGETYPTSQAAIEKLYADGEISAYFTYGPGAVATQVTDGTYPESTREAIPSSGNISNYSFITIPKNAAHRSAAFVLADTLQDPEVQLALFEATGAYPGIDVSRTSETTQRTFADVPQSPSVLSLEELSANAQPELASAYLTRIEKDWTAQVLQK